MSYKVIARKYRPSTFEEVIGQEHITKTISKSIVQGKIAHAYLFSGAHGVGKTSLARIIAKALNCEQGPTDKPCGECSSCVQMVEGNALDVIEIDGASNRGIDNIRSIIESSRISPVAGKYKIYIIDEVHQITVDAFNALLKTLEEPPSHVVFILATTEAEKVLSTIKSRCQQYTFRNLSITDIENILKHILSKENIAYEDEAIFLIAKNARGSVRDAETILEKMIAYTSDKSLITRDDVVNVVGGNNFNFIKELFTIMMQEDKKAYFAFIEQLFAEAIDPKTFLINLIEYMRIVLMMKVGIEDTQTLEISETDRQDLLPFVSHYSPKELDRILEYILNVEEKVRYAAQPRIIFQMRLVFLLDISNMASAVDIIAKSSDSEEPASIEPKPLNKEKDFSILKPPEQSDRVKPTSNDDKKNVFYKKILSFIYNESSTIYSLLSQGTPKYSEGTVLFVELPSNAYEMISADKRSGDLVKKALAASSTNPNLRIEFIKSEEGKDDMIEKLKTTFDAKPIK